MLFIEEVELTLQDSYYFATLQPFSRCFGIKGAFLDSSSPTESPRETERSNGREKKVLVSTE